MLGLNLDCPLLLSTVIEHAATTFGDTELVSHSRWETVRGTYRDAALRSRRLASSLQRLGVEEGGFVGSLAWNTHRHFELFYGVSGIGGVLHTANPRLPPEQILYTINFTGYRTLFIDADTVALAEQLAPRLESVDRFIVMAARADMPATSLPDVQCYEDLIDAGDPAFAWPELDERSACALCFTSGTTGQPKGVLYSHRGTVLSALSTGGGNGWALSANDTRPRYSGILPLQRLGGAVPGADVRREARAAGPSCRQRVAAPADGRGRRHHRRGRADDLAGDFGALP